MLGFDDPPGKEKQKVIIRRRKIIVKLLTDDSDYHWKNLNYNSKAAFQIRLEGRPESKNL